MKALQPGKKKRHFQTACLAYNPRVKVQIGWQSHENYDAQNLTSNLSKT
jgi:hypothetical protein